MVNINMCEEKIVEEVLEQARLKVLKGDFLKNIKMFDTLDINARTVMMFVGSMYLSEFMREVIKKLNEKENN